MYKLKSGKRETPLTNKKESKKKQVQERLLKRCQKANNYVFDNETVKEVSKKVGFGNPFDATKVDSTEKLSNFLIEKDYFILHLGKGNHKFVKGIDKGFHEFEEVSEENICDWEYRKSLLNEYDTSESNILSVAFNQRITHHFLYGDEKASAKVYQSRRTKKSISYNVGEERIETSRLQMEIDQTFEREGVVTIIESKNGFGKDFAVYQVFTPFVYFRELKEKQGLAAKEINACYLLRGRIGGRSVLRLYLYSFEDVEDMTSIRLIRNAEYRLIQK